MAVDIATPTADERLVAAQRRLASTRPLISQTRTSAKRALLSAELRRGIDNTPSVAEAMLREQGFVRLRGVLDDEALTKELDAHISRCEASAVSHEKAGMTTA